NTRRSTTRSGKKFMADPSLERWPECARRIPALQRKPVAGEWVSAASELNAGQRLQRVRPLRVQEALIHALPADEASEPRVIGIARMAEAREREQHAALQHDVEAVVAAVEHRRVALDTERAL